MTRKNIEHGVFQGTCRDSCVQGRASPQRGGIRLAKADLCPTFQRKFVHIRTHKMCAWHNNTFDVEKLVIMYDTAVWFHD
jgi:hypothetical protein